MVCGGSSEPGYGQICQTARYTMHDTRYTCLSLLPSPEDRGADSDDGGAFLDGHFEVARHAH
jgi:hypothetical protein